MSDSDQRVSRRGLFDLLRSVPAKVARVEPPMERSFSLSRFYGDRSASPPTIPLFARREGIAAVVTTEVGLERPTREAVAVAAVASAFDGVARIRPYACLAWQHSPCTVCSERCPVPGAIVLEAGRPSVVAAACTGCGTCIRVCPAPVNGFDIVPREATATADAATGAKR